MKMKSVATMLKYCVLFFLMVSMYSATLGNQASPLFSQENGGLVDTLKLIKQGTDKEYTIRSGQKVIFWPKELGEVIWFGVFKGVQNDSLVIENKGIDIKIDSKNIKKIGVSIDIGVWIIRSFYQISGVFMILGGIFIFLRTLSNPSKYELTTEEAFVAGLILALLGWGLYKFFSLIGKVFHLNRKWRIVR